MPPPSQPRHLMNPTSPSKPWPTIDLADHARSLCWDPKGRHLAAGLANGEVAILDAVSCQILASWPAHSQGVQKISWHPSLPLLASAGEDGLVRIWSLPDHHPLHTFPLGSAWVEHLAWSPTGAHLAAAAGAAIHLWSQDGTPLPSWNHLPSTITDLAWRPDGKELAIATYRLLQFHRPMTPKPSQQVTMPIAFLCLAWSPDGRKIAAGTQECSVLYQRLPCHLHEPLQMTGYPSKIQHLAWTPDSQHLITGGGPTPCVWDVSGKGPAGRTPTQLSGHSSRLSAMAHQHHGPTLATGDRDGAVWLWHPANSEQGILAASFPDAISHLTWSHNDSTLAIATHSGRLTLIR